jgi:hypothetical protein
LEDRVDEPFFTADGPLLVPAPHAKSFWSAGMLHGRLIGGLLARALEREFAADHLRFSRLTVDLFRNAPLAPVRISTELLRSGHRIRVAEATMRADNGPVARATAVLLRAGEPPAGRVPTTPPWDAPHPDERPPFPARHSVRAWRFTEDNVTVRRWPATGRRRMWISEACDLVAGEPNSPLVRVALAADSASPLAHASDVDLAYINADYSLYLSRLPVGDAVGLESTGHLSEEGIAVGHCTVHDVDGPIGFCMTAAVVNSRPGT